MAFLNEKQIYLRADISETYDGYYDTFWNAFQANGSREQYNYAFFAWKLSSLLFPKYKLQPTSAIAMFQYCNLEKFDLAKHIEENKIKLDFSKSINMSYIFEWSKITRIPEISTISAGTLTRVFANSTVETIDKLILKADGTQTFKQVFLSATALKNIVIEGIIGQDGFDVSESPLTHASLLSIFNALYDYGEKVYEYDITNNPFAFVNMPSMTNGEDIYTITGVGDEGDGDYYIYTKSGAGYNCDFYCHSEMGHSEEIVNTLQVGTQFIIDIDITDTINWKYTLNKWKIVYTKSGKEVKTITIGAANLAKLTDDEKAIATQKGWTIA